MSLNSLDSPAPTTDSVSPKHQNPSALRPDKQATLPSPAETFNLLITDVAYGGKGVGRHLGKTWFVEGALPGDLLQVVPVRDQGRYGDAVALATLTQSPHRSVTPQCPHNLVCGGCQWQEAPYADQLKWKQNFIESALSRIGKLKGDQKPEILGSPEPYHYRNRVLLRLHVIPDSHPSNPDSEPQVKWGYFARGSRNLVGIKSCAIAASVINQTMDWFNPQRFVTLKKPITARLEIQELPVIEGVRNVPKVTILVYPGEGDRSEFNELCTKLREIPTVQWCGLIFDTKDAPWQLFDKQEGVEHWTQPGLFQQVNRLHNHQLRKIIHQWVQDLKPQRILDLFCGSGNLSLGLYRNHSPETTPPPTQTSSPHPGQIFGLEFNRQSIVCAQVNLEKNHMHAHSDAPQYFSGDAEKHLWKSARAGETFDLVILDPPRQGFFKGVVPLKLCSPQAVIYVSCDPATLARDLAYLCRHDDYTIEKVIGLDFFPQTYHIESVVLLKRNKKIDQPSDSILVSEASSDFL